MSRPTNREVRNRLATMRSNASYIASEKSADAISKDMALLLVDCIDSVLSPIPSRVTLAGVALIEEHE